MFNKLKFFKNYLESSKKPFCFAPFGSLYFYQNGNVVACCQNRMNVLGNYPENTVKEIWEGEKIKELRKSMINNDLSHGCFSCDSDGGNSQLYKQYDFLKTDNQYPKHFIFQLSNVCNLKCKMCNHENSMNIPALIPGRNVYNLYDDKFVDQIEEFLPYVEKISFLGGETFLINVFYDLWERIIKINKNILIDVLSNGTIYNDKIKDILLRGDFDISLSIDSFKKDTYNKIRVNADFDETMKNVGIFSDYMQNKGKNLTIDACFMTDNWEEMPEIFEYCCKMNFKIFINYVIWPKHSSVKFLNFEQLAKIFNYISSHKNTIGWHGNLDNEQVYNQIIHQLEDWKNEAEKFEQSELNKIEDIKKLVDSLSQKLFAFISHKMSYLSKTEVRELVDKTIKRICNIQNFLSNNEEFAEFLKALHRIPVYEIVMEGLNSDEDTAMDRFMMFK